MITKSVIETQKIAQNLARKLKGGEVLALYGELGAGKTTFVQALGKALGVGNRMISPTFVIMRNYDAYKFKFHHIDLYRLNSEKEIKDLGVIDLFGDDRNVVAIEWAEKMENLLPKNTVRIYLKYLGDEEREIEIK